MANYLGVRCPVCNKKFGQNDDIVVCPTCGAPHHRECYRIENECAFAKDHLSGNVWRAPKEPAGPDDEVTRTCTVCGTRVAKDALFCQVCGTSLNNPEPPAGTVRPGPVKKEPQGSSYGWDFPGMDFVQDPLYTIYGGVNPEEEIGGIPAEDLAKYVGNSSAYYLPRFRNMDQTGKTISPNFSALFFNFCYYFYRRMYLVGFVLLGIYVVSVIPSFLYTWETLPLMLHQMGFAPIFEAAGMRLPSAESVDLVMAEHYLNLGSITQLIWIVIGAVISLCSNRIYFEKSVKAVKKLREGREVPAEGKDNTEAIRRYHSNLAQAGGTSKGAVLAVLLTIIALYFISSGVLIYIVLGG